MAYLGLPKSDSRSLIDQFNRIATDLRVSVTDHCNLRCTYCMPAEGLDWLRKETLLTAEEIVTLIRVAVTMLGITQVRFTGGEPLLRKELTSIVAATAALNPRPDISLTTNGIGLDATVEQLVAAGLDRVNVSLDTLQPDRFATIARRKQLGRVLNGLAAAARAGLHPVKVNSVLLRGINDDEAIPLLKFCLENNYQLRFIEQMPLDAQHGWQRKNMITADEILGKLTEKFELTPADTERGSAPAERWLVNGGPAVVGVIGSVTRPFCAACVRTRLTADGQVRSCLFSTIETDLRGPLRAGADEAELAAIWQAAMWGKAKGHGINETDFRQPTRPMSAIGG